MIVINGLCDYMIVVVFNDIVEGRVKEGNQYQEVKGLFICVSEKLSSGHS